MSATPYFVIDFDSTFTEVEALEVLGEIALADDPDRAAKLEAVRELTDKAMGGEVGFGESIRRRLGILGVRREHLAPLVEKLSGRVTASFKRNRAFFERYGDRVFVISGGFHDFIEPVVGAFGVSPDRVLANRLQFDAEGRATGLDDANPLSRDGGKVEVVRSLNLDGDVVVIGDGWTDYEIRAAGAAERFYAFTENVTRPKVIDAADHVARSLDEVLHREGVGGRWSYPRSAMRVLLLENVHPEAVQRFRDEGYDVQVEKGALDEAELIERVAGVHVLGIRSKTRVTAKVLAAADKLLAVGAFCIGTNQIDLSACSERGVAVFNAPYSNTRSVVELAIGMVVALLRDVADKSKAMHAGKWDKSATGAREIRGKTLGLVGYGAIGSQLSVLAEALGMSVIYYDVAEKLSMGNARKVRTLRELLGAADVVSLHVDGRSENRNLIGAEELAAMKPSAVLLNLSRGHVVDVDALAAAIKARKLAGAALDVFPEEPKTNDEPFESVLRGLKNVILTPHVGGSTEEAQEAIADFASERLLGFLNRGDTTFSVNLPNVALSEVRGAHRLLHVHRNQPGVLAAINRVLAEHGLNIEAQHLKTNEQVGYVVADVDQNYGPEAIEALKAVPGTLRFRMLY
ncbi:phosphoglycerate dehydrogenase [Caulobacter sp. 17J65-9]|nr:phosphoglycerate dehydrogenase [Caulobacter sp. 17J65-9]NEX94208.1 phosphoglycerate dehydrogenase [Caulobacter sp. 17J65-9]